MNAPLAQATPLRPSTLVRLAADGLATVARQVAETETLHPEDQADELGKLIDRLDDERSRLITAREWVYELASTQEDKS